MELHAEYQVYEIAPRTWRIEEKIGMAGVYSYLLEGLNRAALIDCGFGLVPVKEIVGGLTAKPVSLLLTHGHYDHVGATDSFAGAAYLHPDDRETYRGNAALMGPGGSGAELPLPRTPAEALLPLADGERFDLGGRALRVVAAPGHTRGSVCFLEEGTGRAYTGDTACRGDVLMMFPSSTPLADYAGTLRRLIALREAGEIAVTWPSHHAVPVGPDIFDEFLEAAEGILSGALRGEVQRQFGTPSRRLAWKSIGVVYPDEEETK